MYKGAVFLDMDGTLIDSKNNILTPTKKTIEAIHLLKANNFLVSLATGRSKCYLQKEVEIFDCYITSNGSYAETGGQMIFSDFIERDDLSKLTKYLDKTGINYVIEGQHSCYVKDINEHFYLNMMSGFNFPSDNFYQLGDINCIDVNKLMVCYDNLEKIKTFMEDYKSEYYITGHTFNQSSDVSKIGITKGYGVRKVIEYFNIDVNNTYAFGDADNDFDMLDSVGTGIAMGEHTKNLEKVSKYITDTVANEGIYTMLKKLELI